MMSDNNIDTMCLQETWLTGNFTRQIGEFTMLHHGLQSQTCARGARGVAIIISHPLYIAFLNSNNPTSSTPPLTPPKKED